MRCHLDRQSSKSLEQGELSDLTEGSRGRLKLGFWRRTAQRLQDGDRVGNQAEVDTGRGPSSR